jgi:hypothetical protein
MYVQCGIHRYVSNTKTILIVVTALHIQRLCSVCFLTTTHILTGAKKHEAAMKEMARRKNENSRKPAKLGVGAAAHNKVVLPARGMGAGVKNKNKHLQEFENLKTSYRKKKGECWPAVLNVAGSCGPRIGSANGVFRVIISALQTCLVCRAEFLPLLSFPRCVSCFRVLYSPHVLPCHPQRPKSARCWHQTATPWGSASCRRPLRPTITRTTRSTGCLRPRWAAR